MGNLINIKLLQKIMEDVVGNFKKNKLNEVEISFVISELKRLERKYEKAADMPTKDL